MVKRVLTIRLEIHKDTDYTKVLDRLHETLSDLKHIKGEINAYEIRDNVWGGRRLRCG